jgi:hypothetical protein
LTGRDGRHADHPRPAHPGHDRRGDGGGRDVVTEITSELPDLTPEDVTEALRYAAEAVRERELPLRHSA